MHICRIDTGELIIDKKKEFKKISSSFCSNAFFPHKISILNSFFHVKTIWMQNWKKKNEIRVI